MPIEFASVSDSEKTDGALTKMFSEMKPVEPENQPSSSKVKIWICPFYSHCKFETVNVNYDAIYMHKRSCYWYLEYEKEKKEKENQVINGANTVKACLHFIHSLNKSIAYQKELIQQAKLQKTQNWLDRVEHYQETAARDERDLECLQDELDYVLKSEENELIRKGAVEEYQKWLALSEKEKLRYVQKDQYVGTGFIDHVRTKRRKR